MSDNIPFEIQMEIFKKVSDVKSLIRFTSVSKPWKSFIHISDFIKGYDARHTQPHSCILRLSMGSVNRIMCLVDDDNNETFKVQQEELAPSLVSPLLKQYLVLEVVGACHGLLCFYGLHHGYQKGMFVIWNPSIGKSFGIAAPSPFGIAAPDTSNWTHYGFGVCPVTKDPTIVKINCGSESIDMPWHVEVFTLSSGVSNEIPSGKLPLQSIQLDKSSQVVIDRFIYWGASNMISDAQYIVSFDLITKDFEFIDLPDSLTMELCTCFSLSKLRESLVVYGYVYVNGAKCFDVCLMEHDSSFRKLFTIGAQVNQLHSREPQKQIFSSNSQPIKTI